MNRSIILAAIIISAAILLNGYLDRVARGPHAMGALEEQPSRVIEKSIAVLPFENLSSSDQDSYLADGVQDEVLTRLSRIGTLKVISRTSVAQYRSGAKRDLPEIGKALGVAHILEGSVQRTDNRVRVRVQLVDARTDTHLWANSYDRDPTDVFAVESEIARSIADQLRVRLSLAEKAAIEEDH